MTISELVIALCNLQVEHGDLPVKHEIRDWDEWNGYSGVLEPVETVLFTSDGIVIY